MRALCYLFCTVAAPYQHPIDELIKTAEETARILWRSYEAHLKRRRGFPDWEPRASEILQRCMACDDRLAGLKKMRDRARKKKSDSE